MIKRGVKLDVVPKLVAYLRKNQLISMFKAPKFFKFRKPKTFDYQPLYYNQEEEEKQEREKRIATEIKMENSPYQRIHEGFIRSKVRQEGKQRTFRLAIIITFIVALVYLILFNG